MAPATNPKIEELRFKVKNDPKSRLFYPLAEELRKAGQFEEAEQVLRAGLSSHATYLSAWVVLGRVLREQQKYPDAVTALSKALELDRGNVVAARLLAETYLAMGEKVEALKKYKLVAAVLPGDDDIEAMIHRLQNELAPLPASVPLAEPPADEASETMTDPFADDGEAARTSSDQDDVFENTYSRLKREAEGEFATGDSEPMAAEHSESPFEELPVNSGYSADAFEVEQPAGIHLAAAPLEAEVASVMPPPALVAEPDALASAGPEADADDEVFEPAEEIAPGFITGSFGANVPPPPIETDDFAKTITMADLYANQGLIDEARDIYEDILARDPDNAAVRAKLEALETEPGPTPGWAEEAEEVGDAEIVEGSDFEPSGKAVEPSPWAEELPPISQQPWSMDPTQEIPSLDEGPGVGNQASEDTSGDALLANEPLAVSDQPSDEIPNIDEWPSSPAESASPAASAPEAKDLSAASVTDLSAGKVRKLENWLSKVKRSGADGV